MSQSTVMAVENLGKRFQQGSEEITALDGVSFGIERGSFVAVMGASGSGKTTLMLVAAGILTPQKGSIQNTFKKTAFVFQDDRLLPWLNARENIEFALSTEANAHEIALEWLKKLKLEETPWVLPHPYEARD